MPLRRPKSLALGRTPDGSKLRALWPPRRRRRRPRAISRGGALRRERSLALLGGQVPRGQDLRALGGDRDRELEVRGRRAVLGEDRPAVAADPHARASRRSSSARSRAPCPPPAAGPCRACRSWAPAGPRACCARRRGRPASGRPTARRPRRPAGSRARRRRCGCPAGTAATPACSDSSVASSRLRACASISSTANVRAASATQPSSVTPTSIEMMSPLFRRVGAGDAVHDHRVRRGADRAGKAAVALEGRRRRPGSG